MKKLKHYKQSRYKAHRKPINKAPILIVTAVILMIGASIALGAYLNTLSSDITGDTDDSAHGADAGVEFPYDGYEKLSVGYMSAKMLLSSAYDSDENAQAALHSYSAGSAVFIELLDTNGAPRYKSAVYEKAYSAQSGNIDLSAFIEKAQKSSIGVSASFTVLSMTEDYREVSEQRRSYELSLLGEAYALGLREVVLCGIESGDADFLYSYALQIKNTAPELAIGICIPASVLYGDTVYAAKLDDIFDFIACDFTHEFSTLASIAPPKAPESTEGGESAVTQPDTGASVSTGTSDTDTASEDAAQTAKSMLVQSIERSLVLMQRFSSRAYIEAGDGCEHCTALALQTFAELGVSNYMLALSAPYHQ